MLRNINWSAFLFQPETHNVKTLKQYHEDLAQIVADIRKKFTDADQDDAFKVAADAITDEIVPNGIRLESVTILELDEIDSKRRAGVNKLGPGRLPAIKSEASYELAIGLKGLLQKLLNKEYWPDANCPAIAGQSFLSVYVKDFERLKGQYGKSIEEVTSRISVYESTLEEKHEKVLKM